jgi:hypothetical protein
MGHLDELEKKSPLFDKIVLSNQIIGNFFSYQSTYQHLVFIFLFHSVMLVMFIQNFYGRLSNK